MSAAAPDPDALAHLGAWHSARPSFALLGEFSAGKSTLLNYLLGEALLPTQVTATELPPIWITHGPDRAYSVLARDGTLRPAGPDLLNAGGATGALLVRVTHPAPLLEQADMIDTPGISDPRLARDALDFLMPFLDFALWCSPAGQAWRQTEKAMWTTFPEAIRARSILTLTRVDKLRSEKDRERVLTRARRETEGLFGTVLPLDTPSAIAGHDDDASGATAFRAALSASLAAATQLCADRPVMPDPSIVPEVETVEPAQQDPAIDMADPPEESGMSESDAAIIQSAVAKMSAARAAAAELADSAAETFEPALEALASELDIPTSDGNLVEIRRIINGLGALRNMSPEHRTVLDHVLATTGSDGADPVRALRQIQADLSDFAAGPWHRLDVDSSRSAA